MLEAPETDTAAPAHAEATRHGLRVLAILSTLMGFASISTDLYLPALPAMAGSLHSNAGTMELTISGYLIGFSLGQLLWGPIGDRYGRRGPVAIGLMLFVLGSAGCALSGSAWQMVGVGLATLAALFALPETLPPDRRNHEPLARAIAGYVLLIRQRRVIGYAGAGGFFYGGVYAYIAGTPFAYISYYQVAPQLYGLLFAVGIVGIMATNLLNMRLVMRLGSVRLLRWGTSGTALAGIILAIDGQTGWGGLIGLAVPLFAFVGLAGFIVANSIAGALTSFPERAGAVSALVGALQYGTGILGSALVGAFADATPWPMAWVIGQAGIGSMLCAWLLVPDTAHAVSR
jgi:MFS transporter, DHA1 family, multidrug resistance protein